MASRVRRATPPSDPPDGLGRMNASGATESRAMRVLSPRMLPPERALDGSTASTATRLPCAMRWRPKASMNVLLPTPGTPVMPTRAARPVDGSSTSRRRWAASWWSVRVLTTSVMALARARRSPARRSRARDAVRASGARSATSLSAAMRLGLYTPPRRRSNRPPQASAAAVALERDHVARRQLLPRRGTPALASDLALLETQLQDLELI